MTDATALAADIAAGRQTSTNAMRASLEAADRLSHLGAIVRLEPELGLARAQAAGDMDKGSYGPFHGVPFLAKDLGGYGKGLGPAAGCEALRNRSDDPDQDDALFSAFGASGLVSFGLTTVPQFGLALSSEPPDHPPALNPFDETLSPGGSSGGAAAAVASGLVAMAHATDAAGSTRVPAACCGLVGLKASRGRVPGAPHFNNHLMGIASEFVVSRSVRDAVTLFEAIKLTPPKARTPIGRVGLCVPAAVSADTTAKMADLHALLESLGLTVSTMEAPDALGTRAQAIAGTIFAASLASWLDGVGLTDADITPICAAVAVRGRSMPAPHLFDTHTDLVRLSHEAEALLDGIDALVMPVLADGPPKIGTFDPNANDPDERYALMQAVAPNVALANVSGLPALAIPFGMMPTPRDHVPFGFQMMGSPGSDEALLALAARLEAAAPPILFPNPIAGLAS